MTGLWLKCNIIIKNYDNNKTEFEPFPFVNLLDKILCTCFYACFVDEKMTEMLFWVCFSRPTHQQQWPPVHHHFIKANQSAMKVRSSVRSSQSHLQSRLWNSELLVTNIVNTSSPWDVHWLHSEVCTERASTRPSGGQEFMQLSQFSISEGTLGVHCVNHSRRTSSENSNGRNLNPPHRRRVLCLADRVSHCPPFSGHLWIMQRSLNKHCTCLST